MKPKFKVGDRCTHVVWGTVAIEYVGWSTAEVRTITGDKRWEYLSYLTLMATDDNDDTQDLAASIGIEQLTLGSWDAARKQNEDLMDKLIPDEKQSHPCTCSISDLMAVGCQCGGE